MANLYSIIYPDNTPRIMYDADTDITSVCSAFHNKRLYEQTVARQPHRNTEIYGKIAETHLEEQTARIMLRNYVHTLDIPQDSAFQLYENELPYQCEGAIFTLKYSIPYWDITKAYPGQVVRAIHRMNVLYVSPMDSTAPIVSAFGWSPWARLIRCVFAVDTSMNIVFPLSNNTYTLENGDYVAYDTAEPIQYIRANMRNVYLHLHYIVYPEWLPLPVANLYIWIHRMYDTVADIVR